jgi:hypothetical protein
VWKQPHTPAEERPDDIVFANRAESADVAFEPWVPLARRSSRSEGGNPESRVGLDPGQCIAAGCEAERRPGAWEVNHKRAPFDGRDVPDAELRVETVSKMIASLPRLTGKGHHTMIASEFEAYNPPT